VPKYPGILSNKNICENIRIIELETFMEIISLDQLTVTFTRRLIRKTINHLKIIERYAISNYHTFVYRI
jgi:hypothetical protein